MTTPSREQQEKTSESADTKKEELATPNKVENNLTTPSASSSLFQTPIQSSGSEKKKFSFIEYSSSLKKQQQPVSETKKSNSRGVSKTPSRSHNRLTTTTIRKEIPLPKGKCSFVYRNGLTPFQPPPPPQYIYVIEEPAIQICTTLTVSILFSQFDFSLTTKKRISSWLTGLILTRESEILNFGGGRGVRAKILQISPTDGIYFRCTQETRLIIEQQQKIDSCKTDIMVPEFHRLILDRFENPAKYQAFPNLSLPKGILIYGPSGTGKTYSVKLLVEQLKRLDISVFFETVQILNGNNYLLSEVFQRARSFLKTSANNNKKNRISIIFLDDLDSVLLTRSSNNSREDSMITGKLLTLMDGMKNKSKENIEEENSLIVIAATNKIDTIDLALRRPGRFDKEIEFKIMDGSKRYEFVKQVAENETLAKFVQNNCVGYSHAEIISLIHKVKLTKNNNSLTEEELNLIFETCPTPAALKGTSSSTSRSNNEDGITKLVLLNEIGGQEYAKAELEKALSWPLFRKQELIRFGLESVFRGILLYGPPGCGKTSLVRAIAKKFTGHASFYSLSGAEVYSSGFGEAEATIRRVFAEARATSPSILFFDEIDSLVGKRDEEKTTGGGDSVQTRVLSSFLNEMDGIDTFLSDSVIVIGATNRPDNIDRALLRPGRFDKHIFVGPADPKSILQVEMKRMNLLEDETINLQELSDQATFMSGADITGACRMAALLAFAKGRSKPNQEDFLEGLKKANKSCKLEVLQQYQAFQQKSE